MNKKISTLFTAGLLVAGSLFSSAWADEIPLSSAEEGDAYLLKASHFYQSGDESWTSQQAPKCYVGLDEDGNAVLTTLADAAYWTVSIGGVGETNYTFESDGKKLTVSYTEGQEEKTQNQFLGSTGNAGQGEATALIWGDYWVGHTANNILVGMKVAEATSAASLDAFVLETVDDEPITDSEDLNKLFNKKGFSFEVNTEEEITNIFAQRIVALDVETTVVVDNEQTQGEKWGFPAGIYFTVSRPDGDFASMSIDEKYEYLKGCTFIAVSSTNSVEATGADRTAGKGFQLIEISGDNLYKYLGDSEGTLSSGDYVPVQNACFDVEYNDAQKYQYAINLKSFRFQPDTKKADHKTIGSADAPIAIKVYEHADSYSLATDGTGNSFIFKFGDAGIVKGYSLLKTDGPAVYNIKFVSGDNDKTELNKYLTIGRNNGNWDFYAKGEALAKDVLATPAYQFVITDVEGNNVTFTNRESGHEFTAMLYDEGDCYSLATTTESDQDFMIANIDNSTYAVTVADDPVEFNDAEIVLEESTVDPFAGFWNVEDETMVTMGFARDVYNTSNILYAYADGTSTPKNLATSNVANLTDDLYDAAQWCLKKVDNGVVNIKRDYVYRSNTKDSVAVEPYGDVVSIQKYTIQYVEDADLTVYFLQYQNVANGTPKLVKENATEFVIRANADGSVSIMPSSSFDEATTSLQGSALKVDSRAIEVVINNANKPDFKYSNELVYQIYTEDDFVNTYLVDQLPFKSWENEGHVSIQSTVGNYISLNEDKAAIMVDNDPSAYYLYKTDETGYAASFYITKGMESENGERLFMFNAVDSIGYQMQGAINPKYQWNKEDNKIIFKPAIINTTRDTLAFSVKGEEQLVANESNNKDNIWGGLNRFKWQIIETEDGDSYYIRQSGAIKNGANWETRYLTSTNEVLTWSTKDKAQKFYVVNVEGPVANETIADEAEGVEVIAGNGAVTIQGAAGKNVVIANILGKVVASTTLTSDNQTINVPAGIVVVTVDGEAVKAIVK